MRLPTDEEQALIVRTLDQISGKQADEILGDLQIAIIPGDELSEVVLVATAVMGLPEELWSDSFGGLLIGHLGEEGFMLDLQGAVRVGATTRKSRVIVAEKSARLFLYGRDILPVSVLDRDRKLTIGDACIVMDPRHEVLGLGEVVGGFKGKRRVIIPLHELGRYLHEDERS